MKRHNRICVKDAVNHCYQRTLDGFLLFYTVFDYLVFFTLLCTVAPLHDVRVIAASLMPDHTHLSAVAPDRVQLWRCMQQLLSMFAKEQNAALHRKGSLFKSPFGSAPKTTDKKIRTNIAYVANNPVERHLVHKAEDWKWTFLAYAISDHPFSKPINRSRASPAMKKALAIVDSTYAEGYHLKYRVLLKLFSPLSDEECNQLTDYIISKYSIIDHQTAISYFGSYEKMLMAIHSNTGSEYDLKESFTGKRDDVYKKMTDLLMGTGRFIDIHDVLGLNADEKIKLFNYLQGKTEATPKQIAKFLRMKYTTQ